jgi:hypothetical protein
LQALLPCTALLTEEEWTVLYVKIHRKSCPNKVPTIKVVVSWIAQLGGHLARTNGPEPGSIYYSLKRMETSL